MAEAEGIIRDDEGSWMTGYSIKLVLCRPHLAHGLKLKRKKKKKGGQIKKSEEGFRDAAVKKREKEGKRVLRWRKKDVRVLIIL